ncbi:hypothetical protein K469DRAFT_265924 [Zopfia rhizophila CBS 207.26]|uniref:Uncharacterized protein n=1 Tax=Zopfia rhizophila CBS 207.26 TaxID=1314779 RepID=A0A6A6DNU8_9PEZI|nr:hypothetical protein K469DRAFT_265924 [Zopfia rhizophila CBS 207.26]
MALERWHTIWNSFPKHRCSLSVGDKLLLSCLPIFDHTKLALHIDISSAKDALHTRNYAGANAIFRSISNNKTAKDARSDSTNDILLCPRGPYVQCREAARHAAYALKLSFEIAPWWTVRADAVDVPVVSAILLLHCTQIVCGWLSYIAAARDALQTHVKDMIAGLPRTIYLKQFLNSEDLHLLGVILDPREDAGTLPQPDDR